MVQSRHEEHTYQILDAVERRDSLLGHVKLLQVRKRVEIFQLRDMVSLKQHYGI